MARPTIKQLQNEIDNLRSELKDIAALEKAFADIKQKYDNACARIKELEALNNDLRNAKPAVPDEGVLSNLVDDDLYDEKWPGANQTTMMTKVLVETDEGSLAADKSIDPELGELTGAQEKEDVLTDVQEKDIVLDGAGDGIVID